MNKLLCRLALVLAVASLAGCGLKGPLYFPKDQSTSSQTPAASAGTQTTAAPAGQSAPAAR